LNGDGPQHLSDHTEFSLSLGKSFGENFNLNSPRRISGSRYQIDNSNTFGGTQSNITREILGGIRYRFHFDSGTLHRTYWNCRSGSASPRDSAR